jgi:nucleotide-binding universal stress UspA family protein
MFDNGTGTIAKSNSIDARSNAGPISRVESRELSTLGLLPALDPVFPLVLAVTDDDLAGAAIRVTAALAKGKGAVPTVVRAFGEDRDTEVMVSAFVGAVAENSLSPEYRSEQLSSLQKQVASVTGQVPWRWEVAEQHPIEAIIEQATHLRAGLIVMGLARHGVLRRAVSRDVLRGVAGATRIPVLAVRPELGGLPRRVVVAVDFGEASIRAAGLARHMLAEDGEMFLVHVMADDSGRISRRISPLHKHGAERITSELESVIRDLAPSPGMTLRPVVVDGDVQLSITGAAQRYEADMIAVGSDHHSPLDRLLAGSVSMGLAHSARWSMLVVPSRHHE